MGKQKLRCTGCCTAGYSLRETVGFGTWAAVGDGQQLEAVLGSWQLLCKSRGRTVLHTECYPAVTDTMPER